MHLARWHIDRFGHFSKTSHSGLSAGLNVLLGPNEAGKSTLLVFLTWVLFGNKGMPSRQAGLARDGAGTLWFEDGGQEWSIARRGRQVDVLAQGSQSLPIEAVLGSVDRGLFRTVLAFDLSDLAGLGNLSDDALRQRLFAAGLTGGGRSVGDIRSELEQEMKLLRRPRAHSRITDLLADMRTTHASLKVATEEARRLPKRTTDLEALRRQLEELGKKAERSGVEVARLDALVKAHPHAVGLRQAIAELLSLNAGVRLDEAAWRQIERAHELEMSLDEQVRVAERARDSAGTALGAVPPKDAVLLHESAVVAFRERLGDVQSDLRAVAASEGDARRAREDQARAMGEVGITEPDGLEVMRLPAAQRAHLLAEARLVADQGDQVAGDERLLAGRQEASERQVQDVEGHLRKLVRDPEAASRRDEANELDRRWRTEIAVRVSELPARKANAAAAAARARTVTKGLGVADLSTVPQRTLDEDRALAEPASACAKQLAEAEHVSSVAASALDRARQSWESADKSRRETPPPGRHLSFASDLRRLLARLPAALTARSAATASAEVAQRLSEVLRRCEADLGSPVERLPRSAMAQRDLQVLGVLCGEVRDSRAVERMALNNLAQSPKPTGTAPTQEDLERIRSRLADLAKAQGLLDDALRPALAVVPRRPLVAMVVALCLGVLGVVLVTVAVFVPNMAMGGIAGVLALVGAVLVGVVAAWTGSGRVVKGDPAVIDRIATTLQSLGLPGTAGSAEVRAAEELSRQELDAVTSSLQSHRANGAALARFEEGERRSESTRAALTAWLTAHSLPDDLGADHAERWAATVADALRAHEDVAAAVATYTRDQAVWAAFMADSHNVFGALGVAVNEDTVTDLVTSATSVLEEDERRARTRAELSARAEALDRELTIARTDADLARNRRCLALDAAAGIDAHVRSQGVPAAVPLVQVASWLQEAREARRAQAEADTIDKHVAELSASIASWRERAAAVASSVGLHLTQDDLGPLVARCSRAHQVEETAKHLEERLAALEMEHGGLERDAVVVETKRTAYERAAAEWMSLRADCGLPSNVSPRGVGEFLVAVDRALEATDRLAAARVRRKVASARCAAFLDEVGALSAATGESVPTDVPAAVQRVHALQRRVDLGREVELKRQARREALEARNGEVQALSKQLADATVALAGLLRAADLNDVDAARRARADHNRHGECEADAARRRQAIEEHLGHDLAAEAELRTGDPIAWRAERDRISTERETFRIEREDLAKRLGVEEKAHRDLLDHADVVRLDSDLKSLEHELRAAVTEYARLAVTDHLLDEALDRFRKEKQPVVLQRASHLWSMITNGCWANVRPAIDQDELEVIDDQGHVTGVHALSRGTAEQLYLCLRLALAEALVEGGALRLPLVLDDVLVNFDDERAMAACKVLHEVSLHRQVILFSCRPQSLDLLRAAGIEPNVIALPRYAGGTSPVALDVEPTVRETPVVQHRRVDAAAEDVEERIVDVLAKARRPLARSEIAGPLGLDDGVWMRAIRALVSDGTVLQTGNKRGTKYTLASQAEPSAA